MNNHQDEHNTRKHEMAYSGNNRTSESRNVERTDGSLGTSGNLQMPPSSLNNSAFHCIPSQSSDQATQMLAAQMALRQQLVQKGIQTLEDAILRQATNDFQRHLAPDSLQATTGRSQPCNVEPTVELKKSDEAQMMQSKPNLEMLSARNTEQTTSNKESKQDDDSTQQSCRIVPCMARRMSNAHNRITAYLKIPRGIQHGEELVCSYGPCRNTGIKYLYCSHCDGPATKRDFDRKHSHTNMLAKSRIEHTSVVKNTHYNSETLRKEENVELENTSGFELLAMLSSKIANGETLPEEERKMTSRPFSTSSVSSSMTSCDTGDSTKIKEQIKHEMRSNSLETRGNSTSLEKTRGNSTFLPQKRSGMSSNTESSLHTSSFKVSEFPANILTSQDNEPRGIPGVNVSVIDASLNSVLEQFSQQASTESCSIGASRNVSNASRPSQRETWSQMLHERPISSDGEAVKNWLIRLLEVSDPDRDTSCSLTS